MSAEALVEWKSRLATYQQRVRESLSPQQVTLFDMTPTHVDPELINPFELQPQSMAFYRLPADGPGYACIYFVLDYTADLILYIGETCRSNQRWKGIHDCKRYIENYIALHRQYKLEIAVSICFWWDTPTKTRPRQQLESALIHKWKAPFNKECWSLWGQPFR